MNYKRILTDGALTSTLAIMDMEDDLPARRDDTLSLLLREDLDPLSIDELDARISALQGEIARCEAKKKAASSHRQAADELFKS